MKQKNIILGFGLLILTLSAALATAQTGGIGKEVGAKKRLADGDEYLIPQQELFRTGASLFNAIWTPQEGGGRPLTKGVGAPLSDPSNPLIFPRNFNRVSAPDANSCAGCHNQPASGGGGDIVANVFVLGQRFDFATFDGVDTVPTGGTFDESGAATTLDTIANSRATTSMFGSGYLEMLARQMTADLQDIRASIPPGGSANLVSKGVSFGLLQRNLDGTWDTSAVEGLAAPSLRSTGVGDPPNLIVRPFHQASAVISLREFTNNAYNHHHGIQTSERFGDGTDPDGDGFVDEMNRAEVTAVSVYQAALPVPGRVIPSDPGIRRAIWLGEQRFAEIGCADCHIQALPLDNWGWFFSEPNPYNPAGNLQRGEQADLNVNLNSKFFPLPRLSEDLATKTTFVPAYTDMKLHDITSGPDDPNRESLNMHFAAGSDEFFAGNSRFLTKRLWGVGNSGPYFHHGKYTTMREAILAHAGEAIDSRVAFENLPDNERDSVIEFLKSLQTLPAGTESLVIDDEGRTVQWPPQGAL
ncbi:MAG: di-heme oxidoredictase family protein [Acidobacteriota bacterium]